MKEIKDGKAKIRESIQWLIVNGTDIEHVSIDDNAWFMPGFDINCLEMIKCGEHEHE